MECQIRVETPMREGTWLETHPKGRNLPRSLNEFHGRTWGRRLDLGVRLE